LGYSGPTNYLVALNIDHHTAGGAMFAPILVDISLADVGHIGGSSVFQGKAIQMASTWPGS